ncbi:hypothetical protein [Vibrio sp. 10N]|uniref:hypothetical protein n=1 Tax=Vibrio sp. 10N TaxID=3058938 RepID=UPI0028147B79|nr:hypothetical protein VB10N_00490 [Vibrio sp. 10N]
MKVPLPDLVPFELQGSPFPVVDPSELPLNINRALDRFMIGKTISHPIYIYSQDWLEFCSAVEQGYIKIDS